MVSKLLLDIVMIALAINQVCDTWFNGTIFAGTRAYLEAWQDVAGDTYSDRTKRFFANLLMCRFCLSHHVMLFFIVVCWLPTFLLPWGVFTMFPVYGLAALQLSLLLNDMVSAQ